jgi:glycosyltransferase involved in cell wall biosynthesis
MTISICIATFGDEAWAELAWSRAYPSALGQTDDIVVYHGSSLAQARNTAAEMAKGDWLVFLDADDELCPGYIAEMTFQLDILAYWDESTKCLFAPAMQHPGQRVPTIPNLGKWPSANECCIGTMWPRKLFLALGGFRELPSLEDWDAALRAVKAGARIVHVPAAVYCAHVTLGSRNSDQSVYARLREEHAEVWAR